MRPRVDCDLTRDVQLKQLSCTGVSHVASSAAAAAAAAGMPNPKEDYRLPVCP
jgi:hypothetical protein